MKINRYQPNEKSVYYEKSEIAIVEVSVFIFEFGRTPKEDNT